MSIKIDFSYSYLIDNYYSMSLNYNFKPGFVGNDLLSSKKDRIVYSKCINCQEDIASINNHSIVELCYRCKNNSNKSRYLNQTHCRQFKHYKGIVNN